MKQCGQSWQHKEPYSQRPKALQTPLSPMDPQYIWGWNWARTIPIRWNWEGGRRGITCKTGSHSHRRTQTCLFPCSDKSMLGLDWWQGALWSLRGAGCIAAVTWTRGLPSAFRQGMLRGRQSRSSPQDNLGKGGGQHEDSSGYSRSIATPSPCSSASKLHRALAPGQRLGLGILVNLSLSSQWIVSSTPPKK